ncbi:MAG: polyprenyl synthetase family protein [Myxococcales bacterium]|nr:polyprenyl synthetase family protein [Myxococcales bacterium]
MTVLAMPSPDPTPALAGLARRHGAVTTADRLLAVRRWLDDDLAALDAALAAVGADGHGLGWQAARYLLVRPGKRLRPLAVMLAARLGGRPFDEAVRGAAIAAELAHAATLLHDDVLDQADVRRGLPAARVVFGNHASVLGGDHLLVQALRHVHGESLREAFLDVLDALVQAEVAQLERRGRFEPDRGSWLATARGKTSSLFRFCLWGGGWLGGLDADRLATLAALGDALGLAFQLIDDVLDLEGDPEVTGKAVGADLRDGKLTWPLILATERDAELATLLGRAAAGEPIAGLRIAERVRATGALDDARADALRHAEAGRRLLVGLPAGPARDGLALWMEALARRCA